MSTLEKLNEFDRKKWEDSVNAGRDTCGEYSYCVKCNKSNEYPCAKAYDEYTTVSEVKKSTKTTAKKSTKKSTTKKPSSKKSTKKSSK